VARSEILAGIVRLGRLYDQLSDSSPSSAAPDSPEREQEASKIYYRVLENILGAEEHHSSQGVELLLSSNTFHNCLLACASEVVVACYKIITLPFPEVIELLGLKAFDIFKIIQCFVRHEPSLPRGVKRHFMGIEEQVVESLSMAPGSSMFPSLVFAHQALMLAGPYGPSPKVVQLSRKVP
jgi:retinoblastoma-like protein 1